MNPFKNINFIKRLISLLTSFLMNPEMTNHGKLYITAVSKLGTDVSPADLVDDDVACAESLTTILHGLWPEIPIITGTWTLWKYLNESGFFQLTQNPEPGCIIISPTGTGNGRLKNGHTGIVGKDNQIMSNDSASGLWLENYTLESWRQKYGKVGGFPVEFYKRI